MYPRSQYGFAVLYFTGSAAHNIKMRNDAISYGFSLSDAGLYYQSDAERAKYEKTTGGGKTTPTKSHLDPKVLRSLDKLASKDIVGTVVTEREIFKAFGMSFVEPCNRV